MLLLWHAFERVRLICTRLPASRWYFGVDAAPKSRLMESILIRIPSLPFTMTRPNDEKWRGRGWIRNALNAALKPRLYRPDAGIIGAGSF